MLQIKKETANIWECQVVNNANIGSFLRLWKNPNGAHLILITRQIATKDSYVRYYYNFVDY